jgi:flagellar M-ring protein FliF
MEKYRQQAMDYWKRWQALSPKSKAIWSLCGAACLGLAGLIWWASQPEYCVLYSSLSAEEAGAITAKLRSKAIPFKLAAGGTTILVPTDQAMQAHLDLTAEGVAGSAKVGKGLDFFDQPMIGATPFTQAVNFQRAQQAELAKTIMQIDPIAFARVHIVRPEPSPFVREQKPTTAGVMIKLRPGATLSRNTVEGIAALIAGSVEGLTKDNVKIADSTGRLLSKHQDGEMGGLGSIVDQKREVEQYLAVEAERMLTAVLGPGRAIVVVRVDLDNKSVHERKEIINADGKVQKSEKTTLNKTNSTSASKGGAVGSASNLGRPGSGASGGAGTGTISTQETNTAEFEYPRTVQEWQHKHGSIERLTVAAFVDIEGSSTAMPLPEVKEMIKKAVGFKLDRDEIQVTQVHMPTPSSEGIDEEWAAHQRLQTILTTVRNVSIAMIALCVLPIAWVLLRRRAAAPAEPVKLQRITEELDRNPEALAQILTLWIDRSESSNQKAA